MNIKEAKTEIMRTIRIYTQKDSRGHYLLPAARQRPVLLIGPPGIGKTAIMEQIASECGIGLVAYTITHHTRQSAVGLPVISHQIFQNQEYSVTEYTMSEIIASVYKNMEKTSCTEGILFIDEINCVSETLVPTMLQFLQNKTFGTHAVPEGWIIVAAGNPPEYNPSAREFDIVTLDRVKKVCVDPDLNVWKEYAYDKGLHPAVLSYLSLKPQNFYHIKNQTAGLTFATARGWEDLSVILYGYENMEYPVEKSLILQYIQDSEIAADFADYYKLYAGYRQDYHISELLSGKLDSASLHDSTIMAQKASSEEKLTVCGILLEGWNQHFTEYSQTELFISRFMEILTQIKTWTDNGESLEDFIANYKNALRIQQENSLISSSEADLRNQIIYILNEASLRSRQQHEQDPESIQGFLQEQLNRFLTSQKEQQKKTSLALEYGFHFAEEAFTDGPELLFLTADLSRNQKAVQFISTFGCDSYFRHSQKLQFQERREELLKQLDNTQK